MLNSRFITAVLAGLPVYAQAAVVPAADASLVGNLLQVLFALAVVLGLIVLAAWLMRRFALVSRGVGGQMRVVSGVMVGQRERVVIVEVRDQWLVLGVTAQNVNLLSSMPKPEESQITEAPVNPFSDWLSQALQRRLGEKVKSPEQS